MHRPFLAITHFSFQLTDMKTSISFIFPHYRGAMKKCLHLSSSYSCFFSLWSDLSSWKIISFKLWLYFPIHNKSYQNCFVSLLYHFSNAAVPLILPCLNHMGNEPHPSYVISEAPSWSHPSLTPTNTVGIKSLSQFPFIRVLIIPYCLLFACFLTGPLVSVLQEWGNNFYLSFSVLG